MLGNVTIISDPPFATTEDTVRGVSGSGSAESMWAGLSARTRNTNSGRERKQEGQINVWKEASDHLVPQH